MIDIKNCIECKKHKIKEFKNKILLDGICFGFMALCAGLFAFISGWLAMTVVAIYGSWIWLHIMDIDAKNAKEQGLKHD